VSRAQIGGQNPAEWDAFIQYLSDKNIRSYLEVGAREGIALRYLVERLPIEYVAAVDLPGAAWGRPNTEQKLRNNLNALKVDHSIHIGDSTDPEIIEAARGEYDLVFIDGDHSYKGVLADYENYGPMARILAFHDINQPPQRAAYGPTRLWNELEGQITFIAPGSQKGIQKTVR
jgi:predicted O-methyltransferase YrrM